MYNLIGNKKEIAIEIEINNINFSPVGKCSIWIKEQRIGKWDDENHLATFLHSLYRISEQYEDFWLDEFIGLNCSMVFQLVHPFYNQPNEFYDLEDEAQEALIKYDKFLMQWGENFDKWILIVTYYDDKYTFIWYEIKINGEPLVESEIFCCEIEFTVIQDIYKNLRKLISEDIWPSDISN